MSYLKGQKSGRPNPMKVCQGQICTTGHKCPSRVDTGAVFPRCPAASIPTQRGHFLEEALPSLLLPGLREMKAHGPGRGLSPCHPGIRDVASLSVSWGSFSMPAEAPAPGLEGDQTQQPKAFRAVDELSFRSRSLNDRKPNQSLTLGPGPPCWNSASIIYTGHYLG